MTPLDRTDIAGFAERSVAGVESPATATDVRRLVERTETPLYPISAGRNWGSGSRQPVRDGCVLVDLSRMNQIRRLDLERGFAVVEAGVTQRQLAKALAGSEWLANLTPSCARSSVVGNALERGDGLLRSRVEDTLGLEVVLPNGQVLCTGGLTLSGRYGGRPAGPDLTQAFVQANLGIVTAMAVSLVRRPKAMRFFHAQITDDSFLGALDGAIRFTRNTPGSLGLTRLFGLVLTPEGVTAHRAGNGMFHLVKPILGDERQTRLVADELAAELTAVTGAGSVRAPLIDQLEAGDPLRQVAEVLDGRPNCDTVVAEFGLACSEVDNGPTGWMVFLPSVPLDGGPAVAIGLLRALVKRHRVQIAVEFNLVSQHAANVVVQIYFTPDSAGVERAHTFRKSMREAFIAEGFYSYRSNIDDAPLEIPARDDGQSAILRELKATIDPRLIISPGRYLEAGL